MKTWVMLLYLLLSLSNIVAQNDQINETFIDCAGNSYALNAQPMSEPVILEDWEDASEWNAVNVYASLGLYGDAYFRGATKRPTVLDNKLSVTLVNGQYMSYIDDQFYDVQCGQTYVVSVSLKVNYTSNGTGASSYPIIRLMTIYEDPAGGMKTVDYLMYMGAAPAQNRFQEYLLCFNAEDDAEDFKIRLDVLNGTGSTLSVDFGKIWAQQLESVPKATFEDWEDGEGWNAANVYYTFGQYGEGFIFGSSQVPGIEDYILKFDLGNSEYISYVHEEGINLMYAGHYLVKIPVYVDFFQSGSGANAFPCLRFLCTQTDVNGGQKAPDYLMYNGYPAASKGWVDYYVPFTTEDDEEPMHVRIDMVNGTGLNMSAFFGPLEIMRISPTLLSSD